MKVYSIWRDERAFRDVLESRDLSALRTITNSSRFQQQLRISSTGVAIQPNDIPRQGLVTGLCEQCHEPFGSINAGNLTS